MGAVDQRGHRIGERDQIRAHHLRQAETGGPRRLGTFGFGGGGGAAGQVPAGGEPDHRDRSGEVAVLAGAQVGQGEQHFGQGLRVTSRGHRVVQMAGGDAVRGEELGDPGTLVIGAVLITAAGQAEDEALGAIPAELMGAWMEVEWCPLNGHGRHRTGGEYLRRGRPPLGGSATGESVSTLAGMRTVLNLIWIVFAGFWLAVGYLVAGVICCILIITIPWGIASFRIAAYVIWPFGREAVPSPEAGLGSAIGNVIWFIVAGWWLAIGHVITAIPLFA